MKVTRVLVLGGYGNFGKRIVESLSDLKEITIIIAGRSAKKSQEMCEELNSKAVSASLESVVIDINSLNFIDELKAIGPDLVIHTGGPFQGQGYHVPEACISIGSHYIDLADDRRFVCDITMLNKKAEEMGVLLVSGASSVPGLSSAVIDSFIPQFSSLDNIDIAIAPGNKAERGEATVKGILSYTGHAFPVFNNGEWVDKYGWMSPRRMDFGGVIGDRWLANVDIPDLELFPLRYKPVKTVNFQAGLELPFLHFGMVLMAYAAKLGLIKDWSVLSKQIFKSSELFKVLGTDNGGMQINLSGLDENKKHKSIKWTLFAEKGVGPYIPIISTIIIAKKLITGELVLTGATPCLGMYSLKEFDLEVASLGINHTTESYYG
jgi:saccharopine dehydrogenase-like NADP-dependent oxidoreductase